MKLRQRPRPPADHTAFNPATVPVFPVLTVEITDDSQLLVDGQVETIPDDTSATDAAVAAAAAAVRRRGLDHCRVSAVVDGKSYPLVVGADGSRYETSSTAAGKQQTTRTSTTPRAWVIPVAVMILAVVTAGVVLVTVNQFRSQTQSTAPAAPSAPSPTELPVLPPEGWTTHATWAVPLASLNRTSVLATDDLVLAVTGDDALTALDANTGVTRSRTSLDGTPTAGPTATVIDDQPVTAVVTSRYLYWWPNPSHLDDARRVALAPQAKVSFAGSSPLITLPGQHAATVVDGALSDRTIPAGAQAVRADGTAITALDDSGQMWRLNQTEAHVPAPAKRLAAPKRGQTPTLLGSTSAYLIVGWRSPTGSAGTLSIVNLQGETVASRAVPAVRSSDDWAADPTVAVAAGHVFTFRSPRIVPVADTSWRTARVVAGTVHGTIRGESAVLDTTSGKVKLARNSSAVPPIAVGSGHAFVTADTPVGPVLYALQPSE